MAKRLVLVADSVYGPNCASNRIMWTNKTELIDLIQEYEEFRAYGERTPWTKEDLEQMISRGEIIQDAHWCNWEGSTNHVRLADAERKWYAFDIPRQLYWYERIVVIPCMDEWLDLISMEAVDTEWAISIEKNELLIRRACIRTAFTHFKDIVPHAELSIQPMGRGGRHQASVWMPSDRFVEEGINIHDEGKYLFFDGPQN